MGYKGKLSRKIRRNTRQLARQLAFRYGGNSSARNRTLRAMKALGGGIGYGALIEPQTVQTTLVEILIPDLHPALDGYRILHLTDVHYNFASGKHFLNRVVEKAMALDPDVVALTGDFITHNRHNMDRCLGILGRIKAPDGSFVVRGNHDYRATLMEMEGACRQEGMTLLENRHVRIYPKRHRNSTNYETPDGDVFITMGGVGDLWEGRCLPGHALLGSDPANPVILLSHHAQAAELIGSRQRVDLVLSGHTHGGQIRTRGKTFKFLTSGSDRYVSGLVESGNSIIYISRGVGTSAMRFRWNCPPEIALIVLHTKKFVPESNGD